MSGEEALEQFGETLMREVRDRSIDRWEMILDGTMRGTDAAQIRELFGTVEPAGPTRELIGELVPHVVDSVLFYLLNMLEQVEEIVVTTGSNGERFNLAQVSDGLPGELFTEEGWVYRYSKKPFAGFPSSRELHRRPVG